MNALTPLGMVSDLPSENQTNTVRREAHFGQDVAEERTDYFVQKDGMTFAGTPPGPGASSPAVIGTDAPSGP